MNETPPTAKQSTSEGQFDLSVILNQYEARANAATRGPWEVAFIPGKPPQITHCRTKPGFVARLGFPIEGDRDSNGRFIAAARTDLPALVKALRRAVAIIESEANYVGPVTRAYFEDIAQLLSEQTRRVADSVENASESSPASD